MIGRRLMDYEMNRQVGHRLTTRLRHLGVPATTLAMAIGVTRAQVNRYRTGESTLCIKRLVQISEFLKCPVTYFTDDLVMGPGQTRAARAQITDQHAG